MQATSLKAGSVFCAGGGIGVTLGDSGGQLGHRRQTCFGVVSGGARSEYGCFSFEHVTLTTPRHRPLWARFGRGTAPAVWLIRTCRRRPSAACRATASTSAGRPGRYGSTPMLRQPSDRGAAGVFVEPDGEIPVVPLAEGCRVSAGLSVSRQWV
ncbi:MULTISPECIES: hypothetical protein [Streptomyces]|uniref:Uncharacterized protein n=1 Tax=Streptomyces stelliscabiei TaxID=146820 RepID=A0A8I0P1I5_9ACTN|nr:MULTISPECIES: hypothetical protein [Streptomyces]MBE1594315.1 hypothetical protein [Streptomyces stelliscabiei]MDX2556085.1 hypothetical protein [Streptomyces stelliscabiei]MDX2617594.1 hypothetical protein [Streptomyces stelliscabiei]MDX2640114.1 hypothetical protein [Streptomyces stelliscabiei]MDX2667333.1 hypothetical protein [Streptomyces stelliscabiei]